MRQLRVKWPVKGWESIRFIMESDVARLFISIEAA